MRVWKQVVTFAAAEGSRLPHRPAPVSLAEQQAMKQTEGRVPCLLLDFATSV